jgi:hypothetical protein
MKITVTQLRRIIKEEVQNVLSARTKRGSLSESHTKITSRELEEWSRGNWMFESMDEKSCSECGAMEQHEGDSCSECGAPMGEEDDHDSKM